MGFQFDSVKALELHKRKAAKKKKSKSNPSYYIKGFYRTQGPNVRPCMVFRFPTPFLSLEGSLGVEIKNILDRPRLI